MGKTGRAAARRKTLLLYLLAGVLTWPVVTLMIYWGDRFADGLSAMGQPETAIGFWLAGAYALVISALILIAGWLQSIRTG